MSRITFFRTWIPVLSTIACFVVFAGSALTGGDEPPAKQSAAQQAAPKPNPDKPAPEKPALEKPAPEKPAPEKSASDKPSSAKPATGKQAADRKPAKKKSPGERSAADLLIASTPAHTPAEEQKMFHLPEGYRIDLVASEPDIIKPINMKFDSAGRLYVTQSIEYPFPPPEDEKGRDTIRRIVDTDGDGVPDKVSVFADELSIPIGVTPIPGGVFGYSIPSLYRFYDTKGTGFADKREVAYTGFGHRDTHGMVNNLYYWIDGWIYCCHGFSNTSKVKATDGSSVTMTSGNTFRVRIDGSHIEQISFGQVNPFGLTFDPRGEMFTADCHTRPAMLILREGCYQSFGKPHDGLGFAPEIMTHDHGSTGIAGIVYYTGTQFPTDERNTIFMGNPVTGRINHDRIDTHGSTITGVELPDFVTCDDFWFRPVDLQLAPDGSIYVADFYNKIIGHYEVPLKHPARDKTRGRIWRISYVGKDGKPKTKAPPTDLSKAPVDTLIATLSDPNLSVRVMATNELVDRIGTPAVEPARALVQSLAAPEARAHAIWVVARLRALSSEMASRLARDEAPLVRLHTIKALANETNWAAWQWFLSQRAISDSDPFVRRAAADSLGRHPDFANIDPLVGLWRTTDREDTMLIHVARVALRDTLRGHLDELDRLVEWYQSTPDTQWRLIDVCLGIHSPEAAGLALAFLRANPDVTPEPAASFKYLTVTINPARMPEVAQLALAYQGRDRELEQEILASLFRASRERSVTIPAEFKTWAAVVEDALLDDPKESRVKLGIELVAETRLRSASPKLAEIFRSSKFPKLRGPAADVLARIDPVRAVATVEQVVRDGTTPIDVRCDAVDSLRSINSPQSRALLIALLKIAPLQLGRAIVDSLSRNREGATEMLAAFEKGEGSPRLLDDQGLKARLKAIEIPECEARLKKLLKGVPAVDYQLYRTIKERTNGFTKASPTADRGVAVFQKNCSACHQIAGKGNRVGPQLDGVGNRGVERLLEDVLDPNRNVDLNFRASILTLDDGQVVNGLIVREEGPILVVVDNKGKEQRLPSNHVEQRTQSKLSLMPANMAETLSPNELYDLLAYLLKQRAPGESNR